jgi:hypothetical protein
MTSRPDFAPVLRDRRLRALGGSAILAILLGFIVIPDQAAIRFVSKAGFWIILLTFALFVRAAWVAFAFDIRKWDLRQTDWPTVAVVTLGGTVLLVHETFGFKIVMDEIMLLGTSLSMHLDKSVMVPIRGSDIQGSFVVLDGLMDKRPLFFPFLVSLLHDLTGYRPANAFVLNAGLTFVFLTLVNATGRMLAGRLAGWIGVALFAGLPLLAHNATGGGFELLNLVMILGVMLLGVRYAERRDAATLAVFCYGALLLAQVRYESVIYLLPVAVLIVWVWWQQAETQLSWPVVIAPLLMVHYPLQHRIFDLRASAWELGSRPGYTTPFSASYIVDNLNHAVGFFFAAPSEQPNSLVLSTLGWLAVPFFVLLVFKRIPRLASERPANVAVAIFALGFAAQFALLMCYFWGKFDDVVIRRLSLPTHLGMVVSLLAVLPQFAKPILTRVLLGIAVLGLVASGVPSMAAHAYSQEYLPGRETAWRRAFIAEQPRKDYLVIDNDSVLWIAHQISSTPMLQAMKNRDRIVWNMKNRTFSDIFVFQRFNIDAETGRMTLREGDDLGPAFVLETVREERLQTLTLSRLSRLKEVREGNVSLTPAMPADKVVPKSRAEIEKLRHDYLENFVKMLP